MIKVKYMSGRDEIDESLNVYCERLAKRNNSILFKLEEYLGEKLLENETLSEIRNCILQSSADIKKIPNLLIDGDNK